MEEKKHSRFERIDDDLIVRLNITLSQALLGPEGGGTITKEVEQVDGRRIQVSLPEGVSYPSTFFSLVSPLFPSCPLGWNQLTCQIIQPGQETRIAGEGMPVSKAGSAKRKGDLVVRWNVVFPNRLSPVQKQELRKVLN